jgi:hypothetical protein
MVLGIMDCLLDPMDPACMPQVPDSQIIGQPGKIFEGKGVVPA